MDSTTLFVSNIPGWIQEEDFARHFLQMDGCTQTRLRRNKNNATIGFVDFSNPESAKATRAIYNGWQGWDSKGLIVDLSTSNNPIDQRGQNREVVDPRIDPPASSSGGPQQTIDVVGAMQTLKQSVAQQQQQQQLPFPVANNLPVASALDYANPSQSAQMSNASAAQTSYYAPGGYKPPQQLAVQQQQQYVQQQSVPLQQPAPAQPVPGMPYGQPTQQPQTLAPQQQYNPQQQQQMPLPNMGLPQTLNTVGTAHQQQIASQPNGPYAIQQQLQQPNQQNLAYPPPMQQHQQQPPPQMQAQPLIQNVASPAAVVDNGYGVPAPRPSMGGGVPPSMPPSLPPGPPPEPPREFSGQAYGNPMLQGAQPGRQQAPTFCHPSPGIDEPGVYKPSLYVENLPYGIQMREVAHIFRPFAGFLSVHLKPLKDKMVPNRTLILCFVEFESIMHAAKCRERLNGYILDLDAPDSPTLVIKVAKANHKQQQAMAARRAHPGFAAGGPRGIKKRSNRR